MKNHIFTLAGCTFALTFWFFDTAIHFFFYDEKDFEIIPHDFNELWMRLVIVSLAMLFGVYADYFSRRLMKQEKELEALQVYNSMINATHHILNNLLNQMQLVRMEALKCKGFNQETIRQYDSAIDEAVELIEKLSNVKKITDEDIRASVHSRKS